MNKILIFVIAFLIALVVQAGPGTFPQGDHVKQLKDKIEFKNTTTQIISNDSDDPKSVAKTAEMGSVYIKSDDGVLYRKSDSGSSINWLKIIDEAVTDVFATVALDNLNTVAINTSLISDTDETDDLGSDAIEWNNLWIFRINHNDAVTPDLNISTTGNNGNIALATNGTGEIQLDGSIVVEADGTLSSTNAAYESLVTNDDDITNKKYVDDTASALITGGTDGHLAIFADANTIDNGGFSASTGVVSVNAGVVQIDTAAVNLGGTNSATALLNNYAIISVGGAIVESANVTTTELGLLDNRTYIADSVGALNQVAFFSAVNATSGAANLTWDGSELHATGNLTVTGSATLGAITQAELNHLDNITSVSTGLLNNDALVTQGYADDLITTAIDGTDNFVPLFNGANALDVSIISQAEIELLDGFTTTATGLADNDSLVTKGYVDDNSFPDPMTTRGDIIFKNAAGTTARLGAGSSNQILTSDGTDISWQDSASGGAASIGSTFEAKAGSALSGGELVYLQQKLALVVDTSNNKIDFSENGGAELTATIPSGTYQKDDLGTDDATWDLLKVMDAQLEATGAQTYTVDYSATQNLVSLTSSSNVKFLWSTGTNTANTFAEVLGWEDDKDTDNDTSITATSILTASAVKRAYIEPTNATYLSRSEPHGYAVGAVSINATANIVMAGDISGFSNLINGERYYISDTATGSITKEASALLTAGFVGPATSGTTVVINFQPSVVKIPYSFLSNELTEDYGDEIQMNDSHCSQSGYCAVVLADAVGTAANYKFRYKTPTGQWTNSTTSVLQASAGSWAGAENFGGSYYLQSRVFVSESGMAITALQRINNSINWQVWIYWSDLTSSPQTWTAGNSGATLTGAGDYHVGGIYIRADKAVILVNKSSNDDSEIHISDDSGSGFVNWASTNVSTDYENDNLSGLVMQYFPSEGTTINKHRIVAFGTAGGKSKLAYFKGDGSSEASINLFGDAATHSPFTYTMDRLGVKNRVGIFAFNPSGPELYETESTDASEAYNGGTLAFDYHSDQDLNTEGSAIDIYNGYSSASAAHMRWNSDRRAVIAGDFAAVIVGSQSNPSSAIGSQLYSTANLTGGTWSSANSIGMESGNNQEITLQYIVGNHSLQYTGKYSEVLGSNLTTGKTYGRAMEINSNGTLSKHDLTEISDDTLAGFTGFSSGVCSMESCSTMWEEDSGSYDVLKLQRLE